MTLTDLATADVIEERRATGVTFRPLTHRGAVWLHNNVTSKPWEWSAVGVIVEGATAGAVREFAEAAGLKVAQ